MPMQPLTYQGILDLSKPIVKTPSQVGDIFFTGCSWKICVAVVPGTHTMAFQDCTEGVRAVGVIHAPALGEGWDGQYTRWSVAAFEMVNRREPDPNSLMF